MSRSRGCEVIEERPGEWHCVVAMDEYDYEFRGDTEVYGPSKTADEALQLMHARASNPGSFDEIKNAIVGNRERNLIKNSRKG